MRARLPLVALLTAATLLPVFGCSDNEPNAGAPGAAGQSGGGSGGSGGSGGAGGNVPDKPFGIGDVSSVEAIEVLESSLKGTVEGGKLTVGFRVHSKLGAAAGTFHVSLRAVDDSSGGAVADVAYSVGAGADQDLTATIDLPEGFTTSTLADRVLDNVRVEGDGVRITHSLFTLLHPREVLLDGPPSALIGKSSKVRARVRNPLTLAPEAGVSVKLTASLDGTAVKTFEAKSDDRGDALFDVALADVGTYELSVTTAIDGTPVAVSSPVAVTAPGQKVLLTTDKPLYQPGQAVHLRALALSDEGNKPLAGQPVLLEVKDGKGNKVYKRSVNSDAFGIAAATFRLGSVVNTGTYKLTATVTPAGGAPKVAEKSVTVGAYALPKFKTSIATDKPYYRAGDVVTGTVDSAYFFGKLVSGGDITIEAATLDVGENVFTTVQGKLDAAGHFGFSVTLPPTIAGLPLDGGKGLVVLRATVTDTAGQQVIKESTLTITSDGVDIALIPEATSIIPGFDNRFDLYVSDPLGAPLANASAIVAAFGKTYPVTTDEAGHASLTVPVEASAAGTSNTSVSVSLKGLGSSPIERDFNFAQQTGGEHVVLRTDKSIYDMGDTVKVTIHTTDPTANVYVDWLANGQVLDVSNLKAENGEVTYTRTLDTSSLGGNRIEAYIVDQDGQIVRTGRTIVARNGGALKVGITTEKPTYVPGEQAKLTLAVTDEAGKPAVAAVGVQIVDEAVFALVDAQPGLLRTYFELDHAFAQPAYEIHGPSGSFESLLYGGAGETDPVKQTAQQTKAGAALAALGDVGGSLNSVASWSQTITKVGSLLNPFVATRRASVLQSLKDAVAEPVKQLDKEGCYIYNDTSCKVPYRTVIKNAVNPVAKGYDFWGTGYAVAIDDGLNITMKSAGPDELPGTKDDHTLSFNFYEYSGTGGGCFDCWAGGEDGDFGAGGPPQGAAGGGGAAPEPNDPSTGSGDGEPRVRKDFPETLYVNPSVITGADGKADLTIPLADSITTWRVSTLANSASGKLGGDTGGIKVFTDFFTDIAFPAELTRGDEITFPVAVYNYLDTAQTVTLELSGGDWYTPLGGQTFTVNLAAGEVKGVQVPVRVEKVGVQTLTVKAKGDKKADAVQRMVRVVADGKTEAQAFSGALPPGVTSHTVSFPQTAVDGSGKLRLDIYPASFSQVLSGIDSILQTPSGCFEQTTSTTWPNVLALKYMNATQQGTPEIRLKAESLINTGYQRLLTFEHPGGGFSWFGTQDPAPFLSVTAFGLMEFADMASVASVDPAMITRTANWLASQQESDGSWKGSQTEFFSINAGLIRNSAFVAWALHDAGYTGPEIDKGLAYVKAHLNDDPKDGGDAYTLGIVANAFVAAAPNDTFTGTVLTKLDGLKTADGDTFSWSSGGSQSMFYEGGSSADLTATAIAGYAFLAAGGYPENVAGALGSIAKQRDPQGNFGPTQSTVWSLRLLTLAATKGTETAEGTVEVAVDGAKITSVSFTKADADVLRTVDLAASATTGDHQVSLTFVGTGKPSYSLVASHNIPWSLVPSTPTGPLSVTVAYDRTSLVVDETVEATVTLKNLEAGGQNMVHATVGIPPGFEVVGEDFADELATNALSHWESTAKQLELYVPVLAPNGSLAINYRLRATMPLKAEDGGAKVFPYYQPTEQSTAPSTTLVVAAK